MVRVVVAIVGWATFTVLLLAATPALTPFLPVVIWWAHREQSRLRVVRQMRAELAEVLNG